MDKNEHWRTFDERWFIKNQAILLFILNFYLTARLARWILRITSDDCPVDTKITEIGPNRFSYGDSVVEGENKIKRTTDFRSHDKFSKRVYYAFKPIWWGLHYWDALLADRGNPEFSFGFLTLTAYPDPDPETTTVDGCVYMNGLRTWTALHDALVGDAAVDATNELYTQVQCTSTLNRYDVITRNAILFNTSSMGAGASVSAATLSLFGSRKGSGGWSGAEIKGGVYTSAPASNTAVTIGDYQSFGVVAQSDTFFTYTGWSVVAYNDYPLNTIGKATVAAASTNICKMAWREAQYDVPNVAPTWSSGGTSYIVSYSADQTGASNDPKLVVTYTVASYNALDLAGD